MRFVIIDDDGDDRTLAIREIRKGFPDAVFTEVDSAEAFDVVLASGGFDAVVTDYCMGWMDGLDVLRRSKASYPGVPVLMLTGTGGEEVAVEAMKQGVDDYLLKGQLRFDRLPRAVAAALKAARHRRELARSERRYGELFHAVPVGLCRCAPDGRILEGNAALAVLLGFAEASALGGQHLPDLFEGDGETWQAALSGGAPQVRLRRSDGGEAWVVLRARCVADDEDTSVECALTDITESRRAADERGALLGELYHRVNNTLQLLIGMITTQSARTSDPAARNMLGDLVARISAISLVQHRLYEAGTFTAIEFSDFLRDLAASMPEVPGVQLRLELSRIRMPVAQAIPIGLAANELLTNSLKHAFPAGRSGEISIRLASEGQTAVLDIKDNGVGMAPTADPRGGYGTRLLRGLVRQAAATMDTSSAPGEGTTATIRLPLGARQ